MTVESAKNKAGPFNVTGTSGTFPRDFLILDDDHLRVIRVRDGEETDLTSGIGHTGIGTADGTVVISTGIQNGDQIYLLRSVPNLQRSDYNAQGRVRTEQAESDFDLTVMQIQDLREVQDRALTLPVSSEIDGEAAMAAALAAPQYADQAKLAAEDAQAAAASVPPTFASRAAAVPVLPHLPSGRQVNIAGARYVIDDTATGMDSAMWDIGIDGARAPDRPLNAYVAAFHDHNSPRIIRLYSSIDGLSWRLLNSLPLEHDSGVINGGNPVLCYRDGWFWLLVSFTSVGNYDFRIYKTRDFSNWLGPFNCNLGPTPVSSNVNPAPGASVPCNEVWGVDMTFTPDGELHVRAALPFGPDIQDVRDRTIGNRRVYRVVCTDLDALTFSAPLLEDIPSGHPSRMYQSVSGPLLAPTFPLQHLAIRQSGDAGLEMGFAERFCAAFPLDDLIIIPCGKGSSGFANGEWTAGGPSYTAAVGRIQAVLAGHPDAVVEAVVWDQGGADVNNATYQAQLLDLFVRLRSAVPALATVPILMGLRSSWAPSGSTDINAVITAAAAATANAHIVSADGLTDRGDGVHYNAPSYRRLGTRYFEAFAAARGSVGSGGSPVKRIVIIAGQSNAVGHWWYTAPSMIDASVTRTPTNWLMNVKDSSQQTIRVYNGPSIIGPWTFQEEVENTTYAIEGSSIVPRRLASGNVAWDLYCEGHNTIPDWISAQRMMVYRGSTALSGWGTVAPIYLRSTRGIRHGTPLNLGFEDPAAFAAFERFAATTSGDGVETNEQWNELLSGSRTIVPNPGAVYYVTSDTVTNLTILDGAADEFYLAVLSVNVAAGIVVRAAGMSPVEVAIGFGQSNHRLVRFKKRDSTGQYYAEAGAAKAAFSVNKNATAQTVPASTITVVTFSNEVLDAGGHFASSGWTPPAGRYLVQASISFTGATSGETNVLYLHRNETAIRRVFAATSSGNNTITLSGIVTASGADTFTLRAEFPGTGDKTISGTPNITWFEGVPV
ncbi:sialate O-acetylesterase [Paracoccus sp. (in: a-proteobacteria)]|uniref:sialate O-acetylesterase n=1 Tax=Paracoccus sp. TaxID=267 RepID=UPI0028B13633|nr:sialate O-acetylesterase [Paracoccus sp. (in: a-proteobacteria)]